jgi:hypothetical protein
MLHTVILNELEFRLGGQDEWRGVGVSDLADNLTDVVIAKFEITRRRP